MKRAETNRKMLETHRRLPPSQSATPVSQTFRPLPYHHPSFAQCVCTIHHSFKHKSLRGIVVHKHAHTDVSSVTEMTDRQQGSALGKYLNFYSSL